MPRRRHVLAVPLLAAAGAGRAQDSAPAEVRQALGDAARLRGTARLRTLGLLIYDAQLWVGEGFVPQRFEAWPLALCLRYARGLKGRLIAERSLEEMRRGGPIGDDEARRWLAFMTESFPDVREGDRLTGLWQPSEGRSSFQHNGGGAHELRDSRFGPRFFGIWLATHSSQPELRLQLLGLSS